MTSSDRVLASLHRCWDWPGTGTHRQETGDVRDDVVSALAAARRDASQYLEASLPRCRLVPAGQLPCNHRGPQVPLRAVVRRFGRRLVQARQDRLAPLFDPISDRDVTRLSPLRCQKTIEPRLEAATPQRELFCVHLRLRPPDPNDGLEEQLPLVQVTGIGCVQSIPSLGDRFEMMGDALVLVPLRRRTS